jgi:EpsI family protein
METSAYRRRWLSLAVFLLLAGGIVGAFGGCVIEMWARWFPAWHRSGLGLYQRLVGGESYYTHGPLVPLVSALIAVLLIRHTRITIKPDRALGLLTSLFFLALHLLALIARRVNFVSGFALVGLIAGLVLLMWGRPALRRLWFPIAFLAFMVPLPELLIADLNFSLKMIASKLGVGAANILGILADRDGNRVVLDGNKTFVIANVCNGLRTLISLLAFGAIYAYVCRLKGWWRLLLFVMSIPVAVISNAVRIVGLIVVADVWDVPTAVGWFHDVSGLAIYLVAFLLMFSIERLILMGRRMAGKPAVVTPLFADVRRTDQDEGQGKRLLATLDGRKGAFATVAVIVTALLTWHINRTLPLNWHAAGAAKAVPQELSMDGRDFHGYGQKLDEQTLTILETRDYIYNRYVSPGVAPIDLCVIFSQDNRKGTHPPDLCLQGSGDGIINKGDLAVERQGGGTVPCRELIVQSASSRLYFLYTYKCGAEYTSSFWRQQFDIVLNGLRGRDATGALVRVSMPVTGDVDEARRWCSRFMQQALPHLDTAGRP